MAEIKVNWSVLLRHDTAANWAAKNPVLREGEVGIETDTRYLKAGDGSTAWNSLKYLTMAYQDKLTFDTTPTAGSTNPVTSDGIKKAIDAKTVDLSNYYTKTQVDTAITNAISAITDGDNKSY